MSGMEEPLVSVVTPSYEQAQFIEDTLRSVRRQTYSPVEHIVVDGGSEGGTVDILRQFDDDVRWISEPDDGQSDAINKGFEMANGEYIGWLNSDDVYFDVDVLKRVVEYFEELDAEVIYGDMALLDPNSDVLKLYCVPSFDMQMLLRYCFIEQPSLFFHRSVIDEHRLDTDLEYVMDYEFWLRLAGEYRFEHVDDVLSGDRNHPNRKIIYNREQMLAEAAELQAKYGVTHNLRYRVDRVLDKVFSGTPRRAKAIQKTLEFQLQEPLLAFDGHLLSTREMIANTFENNRDLV